MRKEIYINERLRFDYSEPRRIGMFGYGQSGKTYLLATITSQWPSAIVIDPQGRKGVEKCIREIGEEKKWRFLKIGGVGKSRFKINACDLHKRIMSSLGYSRKLIPIFNTFFNERREEHRTFDFLKMLFTKFGAYDLFSDFELLLDRDDNALPIERYNEGHTLISFVRSYSQSMIPGLILDSIVGWRNDRRLKGGPIIFGCDEANSIANSGSLTGNAFRTVAVRTRHFGVSCLVSGTHYNKLNNELKQNTQFIFIFQNSFNEKHLSGPVGFPVEIEEKDLRSIPGEPKGFFYFFNLLDGREPVNPFPERCNLYYKSLVKVQVLEKYRLGTLGKAYRSFEPSDSY